MNKAAAIFCALTFGLAGCASTKETVGPDPVKVVTSTERLACVASKLTDKQRQVAFTIGAFPDQTGKESTSGNESVGDFNTQGAASMLVTILKGSGVRLINSFPAFVNIAGAQGALLEANKKSTGERAIAAVMIEGAITSTDFVPGRGLKVEVGGVGAGTFSNEAISGMDMWATIMPTPDKIGPSSEIRATASVKKTIVQGGAEVSISRFMGGALSQYVALEAGAYYREPMQYSTRKMLEFLVADILSQLFSIDGCLPEPEHENAETRVASAK